MAQIFRHGDDLRSIKKFILIILITHVSFAGAALICKEKSLIYFGQNVAQQDFKYESQTKQQVVESSGKDRRNPWHKLHFT